MDGIPYTLQWATPALKIARSHDGFGLHLIHGANPSPQPRGHLYQLSRFCRVTIVTDGQTTLLGR